MIVQASLNAAQAIIAEASLSFLGLGIQPPEASWGSMLKAGYPYLELAPWLSIFPGLAILVVVLGLNFLGDGLRDALDMRIRVD
jgi:peptide/nickel transport system permease protein